MALTENTSSQKQNSIHPDEIITLAREIILEKGWIQGRSGNEVDGFCIVGALSMACSTLVKTKYWGQSLQKHFDEVLEIVEKKVCTTELRTIPKWNDFPGRTKEEVLEVLNI